MWRLSRNQTIFSKETLFASLLWKKCPMKLYSCDVVRKSVVSFFGRSGSMTPGSKELERAQSWRERAPVLTPHSICRSKLRLGSSRLANAIATISAALTMRPFTGRTWALVPFLLVVAPQAFFILSLGSIFDFADVFFEDFARCAL